MNTDSTIYYDRFGNPIVCSRCRKSYPAMLGCVCITCQSDEYERQLRIKLMKAQLKALEARNEHLHTGAAGALQGCCGAAAGR